MVPRVGMTELLHSKPRVLLVEEDCRVASTVKQVLQDGISHCVTWTRNGQDAVDLVDAVNPDILLVGLMNSNTNDFEV